MSTRAKLKLVATVQPTQQTQPIIRRMKLAAKISEQIGLAQAYSNNETYTAQRLITKRDEATGELITEKIQKRVRAWWFSDGKRVCLNIKYGTRTLEIVKGKSTIEVASSEELIEALKAIHVACLQGELDAQIAAVSSTLRQNFKK